MLLVLLIVRILWTGSSPEQPTNLSPKIVRSGGYISQTDNNNISVHAAQILHDYSPLLVPCREECEGRVACSEECPVIAFSAARLLLYAVSRNGDLPHARLLIERGADLGRTADDGATALWIAIHEGPGDVARLLLEHGADVDETLFRGDNAGASSLWIACRMRRGDMVRLLLEHGADVDKAPWRGGQLWRVFALYRVPE